MTTEAKTNTAKGQQAGLTFTRVMDFTNVEQCVSPDGQFYYLRFNLKARGTLSSSGKSTTIAKTGFPKVIAETVDGKHGIMVGCNIGLTDLE